MSKPGSHVPVDGLHDRLRAGRTHDGALAWRRRSTEPATASKSSGRASSVRAAGAIAPFGHHSQAWSSASSFVAAMRDVELAEAGAVTAGAVVGVDQRGVGSDGEHPVAGLTREPVLRASRRRRCGSGEARPGGPRCGGLTVPMVAVVVDGAAPPEVAEHLDRLGHPVPPLARPGPALGEGLLVQPFPRTDPQEEPPFEEHGGRGRGVGHRDTDGIGGPWR